MFGTNNRPPPHDTALDQDVGIRQYEAEEDFVGAAFALVCKDPGRFDGVIDTGLLEARVPPSGIESLVGK
jgi:hypothetical protein